MKANPGPIRQAFGTVLHLPEMAIRGVGRAVFGPGRKPLRELGQGLRQAFGELPGSAMVAPSRARTMRRPAVGLARGMRMDGEAVTEPNGAKQPSPQAAAAPSVGGSAPQPILETAAGGWAVTSKTRDELGSSKLGARHVSLDFNDADGAPRGVEIVIPNDATPQERKAAQAYVDQTVQWFAKHGVTVPARGVRTAAENGRGTPGRFHTEPFFVSDADALKVMQQDPGGYAAILAGTLGTIPGVTFHAPHKRNDPGATRGDLNERDFARSTIIPELAKLARPQAAPVPRMGQGVGPNPFLVKPIYE